MSGKPQFDEPTVIAAAIGVFWRHGYAASSIHQLTTATGLSRSSLYQRFQDKDGLFREALAHYTKHVLRRMRAVQADTKRGQLEALLREFLPGGGRSDRPAGCMLARCCSEMADLPEAGRALAREGLMQQRALVGEILRDAIANGELSPAADVDALSWYFVGVVQATVNLPQAGATVDELRRAVELAMLAWPLVGRPPRRSGRRRRPSEGT